MFNRECSASDDTESSLSKDSIAACTKNLNLHSSYVAPSINGISFSDSSSNLSCNKLNSERLKFQPTSSNGFISKISNFLGKGKFSDSNSGTSAATLSTCGLILNDRPEGVPSKSSAESRRHQEEYDKILKAMKAREIEEQRKKQKQKDLQVYMEDKKCQLVNVWREVILPQWNDIWTTHRVEDFIWRGIPSSLRHEVWQLCVHNELQLIPDDFHELTKHMRLFMNKMVSNQSIANANCSTDYMSKCICLHCLCKAGSVSTSCLPRTQFHADDDGFVSGVASSALHLPSDSENEWRNIKPTMRKWHSIEFDCAQRIRCDSCERSVMKSTFYPQHSTSRRHSRIISQLANLRLDVGRIFPWLGLFQEDGPLFQSMFDLVGCFVSLRTDIGYVQGMLFLSAMLLLTMDPSNAFITFSNILNRPLLRAFYSLEESGFRFYLDQFDEAMSLTLPKLSRHFHHHNLEVDMFLFEWIITVFSKCLPLDAAFRSWDLFCYYGEVILFRIALGILAYFELPLLNQSFDAMASFLTTPFPEFHIDSERLIACIRQIRAPTFKIQDLSTLPF